MDQTAHSTWFDETSHRVLIADHARRLGGVLQAVRDGVVTAAELKAQEERLVAAMRRAEPLLSAQQHTAVTELLCELTAYNLLQVLHARQQSDAPSGFQG